MKTDLMKNTIEYLLNFEKYSSFEQALKDAAIANEFQLVLLTSEFNPLISVETRKNVTLDQVITKYKMIGIEHGDTYHYFDVNGLKTYLGSTVILGDRYYLLITDNNDQYGEAVLSRLADVIELAMGMWKYTPERDSRAEFIRALIRGNMDLAYSLKDEAEIEEDNLLCAFCAKGYDPKVNNDRLTKFNLKDRLNTYTLEEEGKVYGFITKKPGIKSDFEGQESQALIDLFDEIKEDNNIRIYHVTGIDSLDAAGDAFRMIAETIAYVGNIFPYKRVFSKYELILVSTCMSIQIQGGRLLKNFTDILAPFTNDNSNKSKQLLETLETFVLDAGMNAAKTSIIMDVHTNTVQYRLKRINEVLGTEITGNRIIPGLTLAIALNRLSKVHKSYE